MAGVQRQETPARARNLVIRGEDMTAEMDPFVGVLHDAGPYEPLAEKLNLFGQFVGAWDLVWSGKDADGKDLSTRGLLHFGWILGGRAVQDVWQVPLDPADAPGMRGFYGTTVRFYDPEIDAWRSTWIDPLNGNVLRFIGRQVEGGIILDCIDAQERWSFWDITPCSFRWIGESSHDGGQTWAQYEEMRALRRR
jgi:hypothetical protein